jgi:hypothetical protein
VTNIEACAGFDVNDGLTKGISHRETRVPWRTPDPEFMQEMLFTKFAGWEYEDEVRVYAKRDEEDNGLYFADFSGKLKLREVIVGHRCCVERNRIVAALGACSESVEITKARLSYSSFTVVRDIDGFTS